MARTKKNEKEEIQSSYKTLENTKPLTEILMVDKGFSCENYTKEKVKFATTESQVINYSQDEIQNIVQSVFVGKSFSQRIDLVLNTIGRKAHYRSIYYSFIELMELLPYVCKNLHLMIIGEKQTGKTSMYKSINNTTHIISEAPTNAALRGSKNSQFEEKKTPLEIEITVLDEFSDYPNIDSISTIKSFEENSCFLKYGVEDTESNCCLIKCGNGKNKIKNFKEITAKNILVGFPLEWKQEAILDRQTALIYHPDIIPLTREAFLKVGDKGLNVNIFFKHLEFLKNSEREINIQLSKEIPIRKHSIITKAVKGLINLLYPDVIPQEYIIEGLTDIVLHFNYIAENIHYSPFRKKNMRFILEIVKSYNINFTEAYLLDNRILLKGGNKFFKIALTPFGAIENEKEMKFYNDKTKSANIPIATIYKESTKMILIQEFYPLYSKENHFDEQGNSISFDYDKDKAYQRGNKLLIELILVKAKYGEKLPKDEFINRRLYTDERLKQEIRKYFNLNSSTYINSFCFNYDGEETITIVNFAHLID